jgi:SAM-dependent methyltransferase
VLHCRLCNTPTIEIGRKYGNYSQVSYALRHCPICRFSFVANPWLDYEKVYSAEYFSGQGADPLIDFMFELEHPLQTIRQYEWHGILELVKLLTPLGPDTRWLDFGCGNGGLVRYVRERETCQIVGFEDGWIRERAIKMGIPILDRSDLDACIRMFDVVTAIEVLEHLVDPLDILTRIHRLAKPGGLFFFTTGNAKPWRDRLLQWRYVVPEVHVSYFEPETIARALSLAGFRPEFRGFLPGFTNIIRFKVLKNLRLRRPSRIERALPWGVLTRIVDHQLEITAHPIGWAAHSSPSSGGGAA